MSLHLGNLSSRVRRDELERVFRRFGRCSVQVKDRFGFVVYDYPVNAEKALKTLRGKKICGELLTLSWSNRQPRPLPRARGGRSYESQCGRTSTRENYVKRKLSSDGRQDFSMGFKQPDGDGRRFSPTDPPENARNCGPGDTKVYNAKEGLVDEGGGPSKNPLGNDRWEEQTGDLPNGNGLGNDLEFDRYEPYDGDDRRDEDEINAISQDGSPTVKDSQWKEGVMQDVNSNLDQSATTKSQQACYKCGELGHKMRNCPQGSASRKKFNKFDRRRNDGSNYSFKGEDESKWVGSKSGGRQRHDMDAIAIRSDKGNRDTSSSRKHHQLRESSPSDYRSFKPQGNEYEKKRRRRESASPETHRAAKTRRSLSSPIHSDDKASRSRSKYSKSATGFASHSKLRSDSLSSPTSSSISHSSRSRNSRSRSRSRLGSRSRSSSPKSLSLSTSSGRPSPASPNKAQIGKDSLILAASPERKEVLSGSAQLVEGFSGFDNPKHETVTAEVNENDVAQLCADKDMDANHVQKSDEATRLDEDTYLCDSSIEKGVLTEDISSRTSQRGVKDLQNCDLDTSEQAVAPMTNHESGADSRSRQSSKSMHMTTEEMFMVVKHYGLKQLERVDKDSSVESIFGSARLWPWEIIYYRRLKKGPISTDNYARRLAQNKEFGIIDKYVRSSSGWGESHEHDS